MPAAVELSAEDATRRLGALADVLLDCVRGGASVGYMADISRSDAEAFWRETIASVAAAKTLLFAAFDGRLDYLVADPACGLVDCSRW